MCVCVCVCVVLSAHAHSWVVLSASFEHFFVYCTVNHEGFIALQSSYVYILVHVCSYTEITVDDCQRIYVCVSACVIVSCDFTCVFVLM